jgi:hypothetical protein
MNAMKHLSTIAVGACLIALSATWHVPQASGQTDKGWTVLFDGANLDHWNKLGNADWTLTHGVVMADKGRGYLVSKDTYGDFELRAEFYVDSLANSGIFIRASDPNKISGATAYEVNIYDRRPDPTYGTGSIVRVAKASPILRAGGKWNTYDIVAKGPTFTVTLDGHKTVDRAKDGKHASGVIALQYGGGIVKFRRVEIKPL